MSAQGQAEVENPHGFCGQPSSATAWRICAIESTLVRDDKRKTIRVVAAVMERDGRYLITQRRPNAVLPGMWEFPGGRCEDGETDSEALRREVLERLGAQIEVGQLISFVSHPYDHYTVDLYLYECRLMTENLEARAVHDYRWVTSSEFDQYPFTPADEASMTQLLGEP
ncbi:MAG: (deoxy)nucleoside triphosphate pyrophosphohydrolase [Sandaracinaceae bacterium]|nr:(deoxy)nucleoside triphosphate pyrophosphohydrolase [Sandaracinaceae bacterium]